MTVLTRRFSHTIAALVCLVGVSLFFVPAPDGLPPGVMRAAGVIIVAIGLWATAVIPEYFTSIIFFFLAVTMTDVPPQVVFSGFHSTASWMVFGGLVLGFAVQRTGLGSRIAGTLIGYFGGSYLGIIARTVVVAAMMAFVLPSNMGRIMIMLPIFLGLAGQLGFSEGSNGRVAITLAVAAGTLYPSFGILTAAVPNLVLLGAAESIHGIRMTYGSYLVMQFPVIATTSIIALPIIIRLLFPDEPKLDKTEIVRKPFSADELRLMIILLGCLGLWMTDFAHGISPGWIAMGGAILCLTPRVGMLSTTAMINQIHLGPWFSIVGVIGIGAVAADSGFGDLIGKLLFSMVPLSPGNDAENFAALSAIGMVVAALVTIPGQPAIMTSLAAKISAATGWPLVTVLMAQVPTWTMSLFPYELPPLVVAAQLGGLRTAQLVQLLLAMSLLAWLVILPLQFLWWRYLGYFG